MAAALVEAIGNLMLKGASDAVIQTFIQEYFAWKVATGTIAVVAWPAFLALLVVSIFTTIIIYNKNH